MLVEGLLRFLPVDTGEEAARLVVVDTGVRAFEVHGFGKVGAKLGDAGAAVEAVGHNLLRREDVRTRSAEVFGGLDLVRQATVRDERLQPDSRALPLAGTGLPRDGRGILGVVALPGDLEAEGVGEFLPPPVLQTFMARGVGLVIRPRDNPAAVGRALVLGLAPVLGTALLLASATANNDSVLTAPEDDFESSRGIGCIHRIQFTIRHSCSTSW